MLQATNPRLLECTDCDTNVTHHHPRFTGAQSVCTYREECDPTRKSKEDEMGDLKNEGKLDRAKGKVREVAGKVTGKKGTEAKGKGEQFKGKVKDKLG
jgi:uncharacterized protein YjbJ (UPF0337 family)